MGSQDGGEFFRIGELGAQSSATVLGTLVEGGKYMTCSGCRRFDCVVGGEDVQGIEQFAHFVEGESQRFHAADHQ